MTMIAYLVHDKKKETDLIVLPEKGCMLPVDTLKIKEFISAKPDFSQWSGDSCGDLNPESFGIIVASRDECGDVSIRRKELWRERLDVYLQDD